MLLCLRYGACAFLLACARQEAHARYRLYMLGWVQDSALEFWVDGVGCSLFGSLFWVGKLVDLLLPRLVRLKIIHACMSAGPGRLTLCLGSLQPC
jgi:hypothetical protein